jgi:hypothetical protein
MMPSRYNENNLRSVSVTLHAAIRKFDIKHPENAASIPYVRLKCLNQLHYLLLLYFHLINALELMLVAVLVFFAICVVQLLLLRNGLCRDNLGQPLQTRSLEPWGKMLVSGYTQGNSSDKQLTRGCVSLECSNDSRLGDLVRTTVIHIDGLEEKNVALLSHT